MSTNMMPVGMILKSRTLPVMKESLAQYVSRVMREKDLSGYEVQRRSRDRITQSHVHRIQNGQAKNVSADKLQALAKGLDVPATELFAIVTGKAVTGSELTHDR